MPTDFVETSVFYGMTQEDGKIFDKLNKGEKKKLMRLIARISEKSFRRGYRHCHAFRESGRPMLDPYDLDKVSLDKSPLPDHVDVTRRRARTETALEMLHIQYSFGNIGLYPD